MSPPEKPTLVCSVWTKKTYHPDSLRVQLKCIWKTKKKFDIQVVGQNLFLISFEDEEDVELGEALVIPKAIDSFWSTSGQFERNKIHLTTSPFWLKVGPCPSASDKKDLIHAIGSTFGGILGSKIKGDFCRIRVVLDVEKPLCWWIFVVIDSR